MLKFFKKSKKKPKDDSCTVQTTFQVPIRPESAKHFSSDYNEVDTGIPTSTSDSDLLAVPSGTSEASSTPFSMLPRSKSTRVHTRLRRVESVPDCSVTAMVRRSTQAHLDLQRSISLDNLDDVDEPRKQRTRSTVVTRSWTRKHGPLVSQRSRTESNPMKVIYKPKTVEALTEVLQVGMDVNIWDDNGEAPIHTITKRRRRDRDKAELLLTLLTNSNADVNFKTRRGRTALHIAVEQGDELSVKVLIAFGANHNELGPNQFTPLDLAIHNAAVPKLEELLISLEGKSGVQLLSQGRRFSFSVPRLNSHAQSTVPPCSKGDRMRMNEKLNEYIQRKEMKKLYAELEHNVNRRMSLSQSFSDNEAISIALQQREMALYNKTIRMSTPEPSVFGLEGGSRILFLDGGGIKGLVEIEVLMQLEEATGRRITDLFDWIVGTSTGGIIALGLVYAEKSLRELRQLYFKIRNQIFARARAGFAYNSDALERLLIETFGTKMHISDVKHPNVLISAVNKSTTQLQLNFFNNCFGDDYSEELVWKVARYTSAAPMFFKEFENYTDGGVLANNPSEFGLTAIQNFYRLQRKRLPIALVVSVGTGVYPAEKLGKIDAQEFLYFGKHWLKLDSLRKRAQNLLSLLSNALVESEMVANNCRSRCEERGIPFYRFSPKLDDVIAAGEIDTEKLLSMIIQTKLQTSKQGLGELVEMFHMVAAASKRLSLTSAIEETEETEIENSSD